MDIIGTILWPIKWVVELILVAWHWLLTTMGMDPAAGITWVLAIVGLTVVVRAALIPIFVRQIKNQRRMLEIAPQLKKIQDKYKGKKDQFSREAMSRETMELYKKTGTNPLSSCLPLLLQMPVFFSLFQVLNGAQSGKAGVGPLNATLAQQFGNATLFGVAPLHQSFQGAMNAHPPQVAVMVIAAVMVVLMTGSQFLTQLQIVSKNMSPETKASPQPAVQAAADPPVPAPLRVPVLRLRVPARRHVLLADLEPLDHGSAVPGHSQHADPGLRRSKGS